MDVREAQMQNMIEEHEIRKVLYRYTRGVDRLDADLIRSVYHADSKDDHGAYKGSGAEFGDFVVKALGEHTETTQHSLNQSLIDVDGMSANAETYFVAYHTRKEEDGEYLDRFGGRYVDRLEKRLGQWKISNRVVVREWATTEKVEGAYYKAEDFAAGKRNRDDIAYTGV